MRSIQVVDTVEGGISEFKGVLYTSEIALGPQRSQNDTQYLYVNNRDVAGKGHHRFQEGRLLFNDQASLVMLLAVAPESAIRRIAAGLAPLFRKQSGVMFISDVQVVRLEHFTRPEAG